MISWSSGREADDDGLENHCTERYRGFESFLLRFGRVMKLAERLPSNSIITCTSGCSYIVRIQRNIL